MAECEAGVCKPVRTQGLKAPAPRGSYKLISLTGTGVFVGGHISKQGGDTDLTFVILDIDGQNVINLSYAAMRNLGFTADNPYGLVLLPSTKVDNLAFGFPTPLRYEQSLLLSATVNEDGVVQILANIVHGE
jgi:hypothetical protein